MHDESSPFIGSHTLLAHFRRRLLQYSRNAKNRGGIALCQQWLELVRKSLSQRLGCAGGDPKHRADRSKRSGVQTRQRQALVLYPLALSDSAEVAAEENKARIGKSTIGEVVLGETL